MHDVIVAGAGPAGNIAAQRMAQNGYDVVVLDWRENLGDKLCTGIIGRECLERYPPDERDVVHEARSATVVTPSGERHRVAKGQPQAFVIDRVSFVASLARKAQEAGAAYELGEKVQDIQRTPKGVTVHTRTPAGKRAHHAKMVVIASGSGSALVRMVGLNGRGRSDYMMGCQTEVVAGQLEDTEVYLGDGVAPGSFGWLVPLSGGHALAGLASRHKLNGHMSSFLSGLQQQGKVKSMAGEPRRWSIPIRPLSRTYTDRVLVSGDAAGFVKPTTGGGIYYALISGEIAANAVDRAVSADDFSERALKEYETEWKAVFGKELRIGYYARRLYETLSDGQVDYLVSEFLKTNTQKELLSASEFAFDWHSGLILKAVGHRELGKVIRSFGAVVTPFLSRLSGSRPG